MKSLYKFQQALFRKEIILKFTWKHQEQLYIQGKKGDTNIKNIFLDSVGERGWDDLKEQHIYIYTLYIYTLTYVK